MAGCRKSSGAKCINGKCICPEGYCALEGRCLRPVSQRCSLRSVASVKSKGAHHHTGSPGVTKGAFKAWISQELLTYLAKDLVSFLSSSIQTATIPSFDGDKWGFYFKFQHAQIKFDAKAEASFVSRVGVHISLTDILIDVKGDLLASLGPAWTQGEAYGRTDPAKTALNFVVAVGSTPDGHPEVWIHQFDSTVGLAEAQYRGSLLSGLVDFVTSFFSSFINDKIMALLPSAIQSVMCSGLAPELEALPLSVPLPLPAPFDIVAINTGITDVEIGSDYMAVGVNGTVLDTSGSGIVYPGNPVAMETQPSNLDHYVSAGVAQYLPNALLNLFEAKDLLKFTLTPDLIPKDAQLVLNTATLSVWIPQLIWLYGSRDMAVTILAIEPPKATIEAGYVSATSRVYLNYSVAVLGGGWEPVFTTSTGMDIGISVWVEQPAGNESLLQEGAGGSCPRDTGGSCSFVQCDYSRQAVCRSGSCVCPPGWCAVNGRCERSSTPPPTPAPRPTTPQVVKFYTKALNIHDWAVVESKVGKIPHECFNWMQQMLMPVIEKVVNFAEGYVAVPLTTTNDVPFSIMNSEVDFQTGSARLLTDFQLDTSSQPLGKLLVDTVSRQIQGSINDLLYKA